MIKLKGGYLIASLFFTSPAFSGWEVGAARTDITPVESVPLAGYGGKTRMSQNIVHPIWLKALAIRDEKLITDSGLHTIHDLLQFVCGILLLSHKSHWHFDQANFCI